LTDVVSRLIFNFIVLIFLWFCFQVRPRTDEGSSSVGLIAGVTVGTVALTVIVAFLVYRRHSK